MIYGTEIACKKTRKQRRSRRGSLISMRHVRDYSRRTSRSFLFNHSRQANIPIQAAHDTPFYSDRCSRCMVAEWSPRLARDSSIDPSFLYSSGVEWSCLSKFYAYPSSMRRCSACQVSRMTEVEGSDSTMLGQQKVEIAQFFAIDPDKVHFITQTSVDMVV
jgi:hypothetical protein